MGLFDKFLGKQKETQARLILLAGVMSSEIMLEKNQLSKGAVFEVLLFSSLHILQRFRSKKPQQYSTFEAEYFLELHRFAKEEGILNKIPCEFTDFVNNRFQLYGQQMNAMYDNSEGTSIPTKIAFNFYDTPLTLNSGDSFDLPAIMMLTMKIKHLFEALDGSIDLVLNNKFDSSVKKNENFSEENIKKTIALNASIIFDVIKRTKEYFGLTGVKKQYAEEYLKYVCFIASGAVLSNKLNNLGFTEKDEEWKRVFRTVYYNSLDFCKRFVSTKLIEFPMFNTLEEEFLLLTIKVKFEEYTSDVKHFFDTNEPCHTEEIVEDEDDEEYGTYINIIQYRFIQETHQIKFEETPKGISLEFHFEDDYDDYGLEDSITQTLNCIKTLADS
jgi:hypothetical protein